MKNKKIFLPVLIGGIVLFLIGALILIQVVDAIRNGTLGQKKTTYTADENTDRVISEKAGLPVFSAESGFYDEAFLLTITAEDGEIYYTLDGTDPSNSKTAKLYESVIDIHDNTSDRNIYSAETDIVLGKYWAPNYRVDKGMILKVAVKDGEGNFGETVTKSYFVGKDADFYQQIKVISLVTNPYHLFDGDTGIYVVGNGYYQWKKSADFDPTMEDWRVENPTNYNNSGREWERPATIQVFEGGQLVYEQDLGIRLAGNVSRSNAQKSIRLYAREEYGEKKIRYAFFDDLTDINGEAIEKFDKVTLRNEGNDTTSAFLRDELVQSLCADRAVGTQAEEPCILFIDGEFWGMYHIKERIEDYYFASHYDVDKKNVTYIKKTEIEGSEEVCKEYEQFYNWAMSADLTLEENYQKVADTIDLQSMMDYFAIETYINNYDWLKQGKEPNNFLMWRVNETVDGNAYADGKWRFVLFDMEYSANLYGQEGTKPEFDSLQNISTQNDWTNLGALFFRLLQNKTFCDSFYTNYLEIMDQNFDPNKVSRWIDDYCGEYGSAISETFRRFIGADSGHLQYNISSVKDFYNKRPAYARQYLDALCK